MSVGLTRGKVLAAACILALTIVGCERSDATGIGPAAASIAPLAHSQDVTQTYFFGSSSTDAGNLAALGPFIPSPPYVQGRASNGPVWAEYFADLLGTDATASLLAGSNYAVGGARTSVPVFGFIPPVTAQVDDYLARAGRVADPRALYVLQPAANDLTVAKLQPPVTAKQIMTDAVASTETMLTALYEAGARRFVLLTVPQLPTAPTSPVLVDGTNLATLVNDGFRALAANFEGLGTRIAIFDLHGLVEDVVDNPGAFGLRIVHCSYMGKDFLTILAGNRTPEPCDPTVPVDGYMMFDDEHFTTTMHRIVAQELYDCHRYLRGAGSAPAISRSHCVEAGSP